jgi:hypothetical protein
VIASHANEPATINGKVTPNSRTAAFMNAQDAGARPAQRQDDAVRRRRELRYGLLT